MKIISIAAIALVGAVPLLHAEDQSNAPAAKTELSVTRYTELPLSEFQRKVMNEATKLSYACRYFRRLYGRWPKDIEEIKRRTEGIDFVRHARC